MSETKFTNGPWYTEYRKDMNGMHHQEVFDGAGESICHCCWYPVKISSTVTGTNREANANLIAAAPELYGALERLKIEIVLSDVDMAYIDSHFKPHLERAGRALAKARGEA